MKTTINAIIAIALLATTIAGCKKEEDKTTTTPGFTAVATDASGDGANSALLDGTKFEYKHDKASDSLWFLLTVASVTSTQPIGVNVMVNIPGGGSTFNFWGNDNKNAFHKLLTFWVTGTAPSTYTGTIGISDAAGVGANNYASLSSGNISGSVSSTDKTILLGLKRTDLISNAEFTGTTITVKAAAAVGSNASWNDDIYSSSASITLTK